MTATPKPETYPAPGEGQDFAALLAEAPTMDLPADHPYWDLPDDLRRGITYDQDIPGFQARGDVVDRLLADHGWRSTGADLGVPVGAQGGYYFPVAPSHQPKVINVPAREVAKRLIDRERVVVEGVGEVVVWSKGGSGGDTDYLTLHSNDGSWADRTIPLDSTVPVIEDES